MWDRRCHGMTAIPLENLPPTDLRPCSPRPCPPRPWLSTTCLRQTPQRHPLTPGARSSGNGLGRPPPRFCANEPHSGLPKGVLLHWFSRQHAHKTQSQPPPLLLPPPSPLQARPCNEPQARSSPRCSNSVQGHSFRPRQTPLPHSPPPLPFLLSLPCNSHTAK